MTGQGPRPAGGGERYFLDPEALGELPCSSDPAVRVEAQWLLDNHYLEELPVATTAGAPCRSRRWAAGCAAGVDRAFWFVWGDGHQHVEEWSQFVASGPQGWQFGDWSRATVTLRLDGVTEDEACRTMLRSFNVAAD